MTEPRKALFKEQKTRLLAEYARLKAWNKNYRDRNKLLFFKPDGKPGELRQNPSQRKLIEAWKNPIYKVFVYSGGNRIGKTTALAIICNSTMFGEWPWDNQPLYFPHDDPRKIRIIGQDWEQHIKAVLVPKLKEWWPQDRKVIIKKNSLGVEALWTDVQTGSTLEILSNKQESAVHEGWDGDLIAYDEPPKRDIRIANARGLIDKEGRELFSMTLLKEAWVQTDVVNACDEKGRPDRTVFSINSDIKVNIGYGITEKGVEQYAKTLKEDEKDARLRGKPSYLSGLICKNWDREKHLKKRFKIPLDWLVDVHIDTHPRKEHAIIFVAVSPNNMKYICFEIWRHGDGKQVGEWIVRLVERYKLRVNEIICDPLAKGDKNNDNTTFDKIELVLNRHDLTLGTGTKDKESGIIEINSHLKGPNNEPSLFCFDDLPHTIHEFESWMYDEKTRKPIKTDDDFMEGLYRILLLDTEYYAPEDEDDEYMDNMDNFDCTGY